MDIYVSKLSSLWQAFTKADNDSERTNILERTILLTERKWGPDSKFVQRLNALRKEIAGAAFGWWENDINEFKVIIQLMLDTLEIDNHTITNLPENQPITHHRTPNNKNVFIVHGHNEEMKQSTARFLEKLDLVPIILHEQANYGASTIIEKFQSNSDVDFAIILYSADDKGYLKSESSKNAQLRPRMNVVFEFGFFLAKLSKNRVIVLHENIPELEILSDIQGVIYIGYNSQNSGWKTEVVKELKAAGYQVDMNKLV